MLVESFSGIRGLYKEDITEGLIRNYVLSFAGFLKKKNKKPKAVIGMDTRPSSKTIKELMKKSFIEQGINVIDAGYNTTPAIQHGVRHFKADGGVMITASHNEPEFNGWKFLRNNGSVLKPEEIQEVIENSKNPISEKAEKGKEENKEKELQKSYVDFVLKLLGKEGIKKIRKANLKVVVDPNGGTAATVIKQLLKKLNVRVIEKNMELCKFNRLIEPNAESLSYLADEIEKSNADLAAGWDCDGDRVELVIPGGSSFSKEMGTMLSGQYILALLVEEILSRYKGENKIVVTNDATSNLVTEIAEKYDADVVEVEVGEINVVDKMDELNAPVGGEGSSSGGIFPPSKCRDGILTLMMILKLMAERSKKITEILEEFPRYYNSRTNVECSAEEAIKARKKLEGYWKGRPEVKDIRKTGDETGGLKIILGKGWVWYRASKTEAGVFRIITDAKSKEKADELLELGKQAFEECSK
jgi:phosphomannomutase/phosphoglucomutase